MRDWTKAMAALLAAVSTVGVVQVISAQEATTAPAAVKAEDKDTDPFARSAMPVEEKGAGKDLTKAELKVSDVGTIEIHVRDANITDVLRTLSIQTKKNIITTKAVTGTVTANLYNVTVREALDAVLHANGFAYREKGNFIYVYSAEELKKIVRDERRQGTRIFRLSYTTAADMKDLITPALSDNGKVQDSKASEKGLPETKTEAGGNSLASNDVLVVTDYEDNLVKIQQMIKELDQRPQQVLIEATILDVALSDTNSLGIDFTLLGGVDFGNVGGTQSWAFEQTVSDPKDAFFDPNLEGNSVGTSIKGAGRKGLNVGLAYNNVAVFINALEEVVDTNILSNPKILAVNKQPGSILVGNSDGYLTTTTTSTTTDQTVEFLDTGTKLNFRPFIGADGFIRMELHPEESKATMRTISNNTVPSKSTTEITTNVLVKDGHTIVIGGLFRENTTVNRSQVPLLGDIPLAGYLFRSQTDTAEKREVIILLTPHIIKDHEMYSQMSAEVLKYTDMLRVGSRQGMMPWGRDRLAEMSYQRAREEMNKKYYDRDRAMWYLDCATNLNPTFSEALLAKEQVTGKIITESDNSCLKHFVLDCIREERLGTSPAVEGANVLPPVVESANVLPPVVAEPAKPDVKELPESGKK